MRSNAGALSSQVESQDTECMDATAYSCRVDDLIEGETLQRDLAHN
jgi:hypothetical protein